MSFIKPSHAIFLCSRLTLFCLQSSRARSCAHSITPSTTAEPCKGGSCLPVDCMLKEQAGPSDWSHHVALLRIPLWLASVLTSRTILPHSVAHSPSMKSWRAASRCVQAAQSVAAQRQPQQHEQFSYLYRTCPPVCIQRHLQLGQGGNGLAWLAFSSRRHRSKASQVERVQRRIGMKLIMLKFHAIAFFKCWCSPSSAVLGLCSALLFQLSTSYRATLSTFNAT